MAKQAARLRKLLRRFCGFEAKAGRRPCRTPTVIPGAAPPRPRLGRGRRIYIYIYLFILYIYIYMVY